jgi:hypothetical protein
MTGVTLLKWESVALGRQLLAFLATGRGIVAVVFTLLASPSLYQIGRSGVLDDALLSPPALRGAVILSHLAFLAACGALIAATAARVFVITPRPEPLAAMPWCARAVALHRLHLRVIVPSVLTMGLLFGTFCFQALAAASGGSRRFFLAYVPALGLYLAAVAAAAVLAARAAWAHPAQRASRAALVLHGGFVSAMLLFGAMIGVPAWLGRAHPGALESVDRLARATSDLGQLPLTAAFAARNNDVHAFLLSMTAVVAAAVAGSVGLGRWATATAVPDSAEGGGDQCHRSAFYAGRWARSAWRLPALFWLKDVTLAYTRSPWRYTVEQSLLLGTPLMVVALTASTQPAVLRRGYPLLLALLGVAMLGALRGLGSLGSEGRGLVRLRAILSSGDLFRLKASTGALFAAAHGAAYGPLLVAGAWLGRVHDMAAADLLSAALVTAAAGAVFATLATAVGFLLPVFGARRRGWLLGGSRIGLALYLTLVVPVSLLIAGGWSSRRIGTVALAVAGAAAAFGFALVLAAWAARRMEHRDL